MTILKIRGGKLLFVRNNVSFSSPFSWEWDSDNIYTVKGLNGDFLFTDHIDNFLDESETPAWAGSNDSLDEFLGTYAGTPTDISITDRLYNIDQRIATNWITQKDLETYRNLNQQNTPINLGNNKATGLAQVEIFNGNLQAVTVKFFNAGASPNLSTTPAIYQITVPAGGQYMVPLNGYFQAIFPTALWCAATDDPYNGATTFTSSGAGLQVRCGFKNI